MNGIVATYRTTLGKKYVVAVTGIMLFTFVLIHMIGNLQIYFGAEKLNNYAAFLQSAKPLLWTVRSIMLLAVGVHLLFTLLLFLKNFRSRPINYKVTRRRETNFASRTMIWSGPTIAAFVVYHFLHFTTGATHHNFEPGNVYANVIAGFSILPVAIVYIIANILLGLHLMHGLWSWFQTLGLAHPAYNPWRFRFANFFAWLIILGNVSMPLSVQIGWIS
jgi:succinate dehydrogenase / fumarate reductase cytochrome b subunit